MKSGDLRQYAVGTFAFASLWVIRYSFLGGLILAAASLTTALIRKKS